MDTKLLYIFHKTKIGKAVSIIKHLVIF